MLSGQIIWLQRTQGVAVLDVTGCLAMGVTGPVLRSAGLAWDLRKTTDYLAYPDLDFKVWTHSDGDSFARRPRLFIERRKTLDRQRIYC